MQLAKERKSKYVSAVRSLMHQMGHATNFELLESLRGEYPDLSATTVHRVTARLHERGELQLAPTGREKVLRYDANSLPHDHFMCSLCGLLRDANLGPIIRPQIEQAIGDGCSIAGNLTVSGICKQCHKEGQDL
ncbi:hypothetical protein B7Z00_03315 [Candidatus Saccharibacteria bacterium 32-50-10]|nr:MAG: hypothetical protein B7Z00_03315 [Candidatus Saccharibacteria bacterium 32-50-10]